MRLPRDNSGDELIKALECFGYAPTRQRGSHVRLTAQRNGEHHISIPNHNPLRIGTLSSILNDIGIHFKLTRDEFLKQLFG